MISKLECTRLTIRNSWVLFLISALIAYAVLPLVFEAGIRWYTQEVLLTNTIYAIEALLPIGGILVAVADLQMWFDSEGEEAMRACSGGTHTCAVDLILLNLLQYLSLIPVFLLFHLQALNLWSEYLRVIVQIFCYTGALYLIVVLLRSVAMGGMLAAAYHLFCLAFSGREHMGRFCLVRPNISAAEAEFPYFALLAGAAAIIIISAVLERQLYRRWIS